VDGRGVGSGGAPLIPQALSRRSGPELPAHQRHRAAVADVHAAAQAAPPGVLTRGIHRQPAVFEDVNRGVRVVGGDVEAKLSASDHQDARGVLMARSGRQRPRRPAPRGAAPGLPTGKWRGRRHGR
jgi:hypothetical protein